MKNITQFLFTVMLIGVLAACGGGNSDNNEEQNGMTDTDNNVTEENDLATDDDGLGTDNDNSQEDKETSNDTTQGDDQVIIKETMDGIGLAEIEISIDYPNDTDFEVEVDQNSQGVYEVELDDEVNNKQLRGMDAFDAISSNLEKLDITKDSSKEDVIAQVIDAFGLNDDYQEYDIEVIFSDGTKMDFESND